MTSNAYGKFIEKAVTDLIAPGLKAMLCTASYVADLDAHEFRSDVTNEVTGTGYTAGGIALTGEAVTIDAANNRVKLDADDANFGTVTITGITQIVVYVDTGNAATDRIVGRHTFSTSSPSAANFTYVWNADGIGYFTY